MALVVFRQPFALGRREITRGEYARFIADSGHEPQAGCRLWDAELARFSEDGRRGWQDIGAADDLPASCISFADAQAYVQWLSEKAGARYRLPSEAEWEYAARAGSQALRPWGDDAEDGCDFANTYDLVAAARFRLGWPEARCRDGHADLAPVGQLAAKAFGLQDMIGNVREWVQDCATGSYVGRPRDGRASPLSVLRLRHGGLCHGALVREPDRTGEGREDRVPRRVADRVRGRAPRVELDPVVEFFRLSSVSIPELPSGSYEFQPELQKTPHRYFGTGSQLAAPGMGRRHLAKFAG